MKKSRIIIAIPRGRILSECQKILNKTPFKPDPKLFDENCRSLTFSSQLALFLLIGFLGSLSTFSTFVYDLFDLFLKFKFFKAFKLLIISLSFGIIAFVFGSLLGN